jgi:hypothetical protein
MNPSMKRSIWVAAMLLAAAATGPTRAAQGGASTNAAQSGEGMWQNDFGVATCDVKASGRNDYFVLEPGWQLVYQEGTTRMEITVLNETRTVAGHTVRVVEEREWSKGQLQEVARNYYGFCAQTRDVLHFGEDVEVFKNGKSTGTAGTWLAGVKDNKPGLLMPGTPKLNMKYYEEIAPGVTLNRGEIVSMNETCRTPAGTFANCLKVKVTSGMDRKKLEYKYFAPSIGMVQVDNMRLVRHGAAKGP